MPKQKTIKTIHLPVLLTAVVDILAPQKGESYLDLTAGLGGHAQAILEKTEHSSKAVLVDRDPEAIAALKQQFHSSLRLLAQDFLSASKELLSEGQSFDIILADLGISSVQLDTSQRGFAFSQSGPLDMRLNPTQRLTADEIVNHYSAKQLSSILRNFGEEPKAREIAARIIDSRPISDTTQLAAIVAKAWPSGSRVHPATRTFQALRIAVNDELFQLTKTIPLALELLRPGGRLAIISFHSLEDRSVKKSFAEVTAKTYEQQFVSLTPKPITASHQEIVSNPRARSAKLRAVAKIKTKERTKTLDANSG